MASTVPILAFIHDYLDDVGGLRKRFEEGDARVRADVFAAYGVGGDDESVAAILREDEHAAGGLIVRALLRYADTRRNVGGASSDALPLWPGVPLHVERVVAAGPIVHGQEIEVEVHGWYFECHPSALQVTFTDGAHSPVVAAVSSAASSGTFGRSTAKVRVTFPVAGTFAVVVSNLTGGRVGSSRLPGAVVVG